MKNPQRRLPGYPFPSRINPHAYALEQQVHHWLDEYDRLHGMTRLRLKEAGFGYAAARLFPAAGFRLLVPLGRLLLWTAVMDDHYAAGTVGEFEMLQENSMEILLNDNLKHPDDAVYRHLALFRRELLEAFPAPGYWLERFSASVCEYFEGLQLEAPYRAACRFPDFPDTFIRIREMSSGARPFIDLVEVAAGAAIPEAVFSHPALAQLRRLTHHLLIWCNDYFSAEKERSQDISNLVLVLEHQRQCDTEAAYAAALEFHDAALHGFIAICNDLPSLGTYDRHINRYVDHLKLMIHGNLSWYVNETTRYGSVK
jgi:hypothetical protein